MYLIRFEDSSFFISVTYLGVNTTKDPEQAKRFTTRGEAVALVAKLRLRAEVTFYERQLPARPDITEQEPHSRSVRDIGVLLAGAVGVGASDAPVSADEERIQSSGTPARKDVDKE